MIGLLRSEVLRARSRRVVSMLLIAVTIAVIAGITIAIFTVQQPTATELEQGQQRYERALERCLTEGEGVDGTPEDQGFDSIEEACAEFIQPQFYGPTVPRFADITEILLGTGFIVLLFGATLGATLGGADWSAGSMATLLTWQPSRTKVLVARAVSVVAIVLVITVFAQAVLVAGLAVLVAFRGTFDHTPDGFAADLVMTIARLSAVACVFGLMGLSLATIGRSTVAGLGVFLGYLIVVEGFLSNLLFWVQKITFGRAAAVVLTDEPLELFDPSTIPPTVFELVPSRGWLTLGGWVIVLLVLAGIAFRARDVS